jgi:predicted RNase H-like HicB family nuclease
MSYRIRLLETEEGWSVSCLDLPGCHSQGANRDEALANIREAIALDRKSTRLNSSHCLL